MYRNGACFFPKPGCLGWPGCEKCTSTLISLVPIQSRSDTCSRGSAAMSKSAVNY